MKSPIKYFGGKNGFAGKIIEHFPDGYQLMNYIEPFAGSAAKDTYEEAELSCLERLIEILKNKQ